MKKRFRGLFFKAVFVLSIISLLPVFFIGFHIMRVNSRLLQNEILQRQQTLAGRLASTFRTYRIRTSQFFSIFTDLHSDFGGHEFLDTDDLIYLREHHPAIRYAAVLERQGHTLLAQGTPVLENLRHTVLPEVINTCVKRAEAYVGPIARGSTGTFFMLAAFPVRAQWSEHDITSILWVELDLRELGDSLAQAYPLEMDAWVVSDSGEIISYNGAPDGLAQGPQPQLSARVAQIQAQLGEEPRGVVQFDDGKKWLVASANLQLPGWKVYVLQPADLTSRLFIESTFHSAWDMVFILLVMLLFVVGVSHWVIMPIVRPLARLRKAALRLREEEDVVLTRQELDAPNNEIGDLADVLVEMSEVLHMRREKLVSAQRELASTNQQLEKRVEARTRQLRAATNELVKAERLAAIGQMASIISHEIRNPLAVISNATRLIKLLVASPDPKLTKQFGIIEAEIKQANSIISEVLGYARTRELMLSTVDVNSYLNDILQSYPFPPDITLVRELEPESVRLKIDAEEIKQALRNIISNAVEAMQQKGMLTVGTKIGRKMMCIYIADTGPGIPANVRAQLFTPFFTTKARGTGLGLAVVGKAISRHQGKLFITSEEGKGARFELYLKIYRKAGDTCYGPTC